MLAVSIVLGTEQYTGFSRKTKSQHVFIFFIRIILQGVINHGAGGEMLSKFRSVIYYHEDKPRWGDTVKVAISTEEEFRGLHLKFLFKHRSSSEGKDISIDTLR